MTFGRKFLMSIVAGMGSAIGAFVAKECLVIAKDPIKRAHVKRKAKEVKATIFKKEEES